jgi:hypothetical protein
MIDFKNINQISQVEQSHMGDTYTTCPT